MIGFTGKERDAETGLDYFGARYFSGAQGRFVSADWSVVPEAVPYANLTDPQTLNLYSYVRNNPMARADADGHCSDPASCAVELGAAGTAVAGPAGGLVGAVVGGAIGGVIVGLAGPKVVAAASHALAESGGTACGELYCSSDVPYIAQMSSPSTGNSSSQSAPSGQSGSAAPSPGPGGPYKRPNNATTPQQRASVQDKPCATCGATGQKNNADHKDPLVVQHYRDGGVDTSTMRSPGAVRPQCASCSNQQGGFLSSFSKQMKKLFGF